MSSKLILVTGDVVCDNNFYKGNRATADAVKNRGLKPVRSGGGALLVKDLIKHAISDQNAWSIKFDSKTDELSVAPDHHAFCLWEPRLSFIDDKDKERAEVWQAVDPVLGYGRDFNDVNRVLKIEDPLGAVPNPDPEILVIDDAGLGFRDNKNVYEWITKPSPAPDGPKWVVVKLSGSIGPSVFWDLLVKKYSERLVVIISADRLRQQPLRLSKGLSWEETAEDLAAEMKSNLVLTPLKSARHVIVTFRSDAAMWFDHSETVIKSTLVFDAARAEGEWEEMQGKVSVFGFSSCVTASVVRELLMYTDTNAGINPPTRLNLEKAIKAGLGACRELRRQGHGPVKKVTTDAAGKRAEIDNPDFGFPFQQLGAKIITPSEKFAAAPISAEIDDRGNWMMLNSWLFFANTEGKKRPHNEAALVVAVLGPSALDGFPVAKIGKYQTVDRKEIESLRTLRQLILSFKGDSTQTKPLSLGVFGPPGAGKSYGVKQISKAIGIKDEDILTFNLSQFSSPIDLIGAFHRIRDKRLEGKLPLVFWDEFDSEGYRWLQYLLAPMQDGVFQEGQQTHPIGQCIFIMAGATSFTYETFGPVNPKNAKGLSDDKLVTVERSWEDFKLKKGPDFITRLSGYLNVLGPNRRQALKTEHGPREWEDDHADLCCPIRRALFIRSQFDLEDGQQLHIDAGVLRALLEIKEYKAGSRSLEFLCQYLKTHARHGVPHRSHLPGFGLLEMHVDAREFWEICEFQNPYLEMALKLADPLHQGYREQIKDRPEKQHLNVDFDLLPQDKKASNLAQALRIPDILRLAGLHLVRGSKVEISGLISDRENESPMEQDSRKLLGDPDTLEILAEAEHNGWMVERMLYGLKYSPEGEADGTTTHHLLIPYKRLSETDKDLDRFTIAGSGKPDEATGRLGYADLVKIAGFRVVPMPATPPDNH